MIIQPKATKYVQPLDVYFFRQFKLFWKRITDYIRASESPYKLNDRIFIITMLSFVYNQLCSPQFENMLIYAWQKAGYDVDQRVDSFKNVLDINF